MEETVLNSHTIAYITPNGTAKFKLDEIKRGLIARLLFGDWRKKNPGEYMDVIIRKFTKEEIDKFPPVVDQKDKISELVARESELFIDGVQQDVEFMINRYWNQLNHK